MAVIHGVVVSDEDASALERDAFLYGNAYIEVTKETPFTREGRRIPPSSLIVHHNSRSRGDGQELALDRGGGMTGPALRFIQIDVLHSIVHGGESSVVPLDDRHSGWEPISVEFRKSMRGSEYVCLAIWLRWIGHD